MRRREFITLAGSATLAGSLGAHSQQTGKLPTIGFLGAATPSAYSQWVAAFIQRLHELGWIEGRTVAIEYRWAEVLSERYAEIANEFVRLKVDVIVTVGSAVLPAMHATSTIPIVFAIAVDPVGSGMVASLARPGGNVTGLSVESVDLAGKRLELLRELFPDLRHIAVIGNVGYPASVLEIGEVQKAARTLGIDVDVLKIQRAEDLSQLLSRARAGRKRSTYAAMRSSMPITLESIHWRWARGYPRCNHSGTFLQPEVSCRMARRRRIFSAGRVILSIRS